MGGPANAACGSEGPAGWVCVGACQQNWDTTAHDPACAALRTSSELFPVDECKALFAQAAETTEKQGEMEMRRQQQHKKRSAGLAGTRIYQRRVRTNPARKNLHALSGAFQESMRRRLVYSILSGLFFFSTPPTTTHCLNWEK